MGLPAGTAGGPPARLDKLRCWRLFGIPALTATHAVFADGPIEGQTVLVTGGAGAVGHYAIQLARWAGAHVIATVSGPAKAAHARAAGADRIINYREENVAEAVKALTQGGGVDRIIDAEFGGNLASSVEILKPGGVIAAYGSMADPSPHLPFYALLAKHVTLRLLLVYRLSARERWIAIELLTKALNEQSIKHLIAARFPLSATAAAHQAVEAGDLIGNAVVTIGDESEERGA